MFLFLGIRPGKKAVRRLTGVACNFCNQEGTLNLVSQPNYFHVFWLPLFKIGTSRHAECSHCKRVYYKEEFTVPMKQAIRPD